MTEISLGNTSGALTSSNQAFHTQGTVDWVGLARSTLTTSVEILTRCSGAGVDAYTIAVAQALGTRFHLSASGHSNLAAALSGLQAYPSLSNALWFGFGLKSVVHVLGSTREGAGCLILCAALGESYSPHVAAEVMLEMTDSCEAPENMKPSISQWTALINAAAGTLASTAFPQHAEFLMNISSSTRQRIAVGGCSDPARLAKVLLALGEVSKGQLHSITVQGTMDSGWVAAVAMYFLGLSVQIVGKDGTQLFANFIVGEKEAQLVIVHGSTRHDGSLVLQGTEMLLGNATAVIQRVTGTEDAARVSGRLPWEGLFSSGFGREFQRLLSPASTLGNAIGSAARIYAAIARAEPGIHPRWYPQCRTYCDSSYGIGFLHYITHQFPELEVLGKPMELALKRRGDIARFLRFYDTALHSLKKMCMCPLCCDSPDLDVMELHDMEYCLVVLTETIIRLARTLAGTEIHSGLAPSRAGLEQFYVKQFKLRENKDHGHEVVGEIGEIAFVLDMESGSWGERLPSSNPSLVWALQLFTGRRAMYPHHSSSAISAYGICAYLETLVTLSDEDESVGKVRIVPGYIELNDKRYSSLSDLFDVDLTVSGSSSLDWQLGGYNDPKVIVKQNSTGLGIAFSFERADRGSPRFLRVGPSELDALLTSRRGIVLCSHRSLIRHDVSVPPLWTISDERPGYKKLINKDHVCVEVFTLPTLAQRLVVLCRRHNFWKLQRIANDAESAMVYIAHECMNCVVQEVIASKQEHVIVIRAPHSRN